VPSAPVSEQCEIASGRSNGLFNRAFHSGAFAGIEASISFAFSNAMERKHMPGLKGEVVYICASDLAYDKKRQQITTILGQAVQDYAVGASKPNPKQRFFSPRKVALPAKQCRSSAGAVEVLEAVKLFNVGAISIQLRVPFEVGQIDALVAYHDLRVGEHDMR
jgi:hypothetical protein